MTGPVGWNNVHFLASLLVPPGTDVLDIGCGTGAVGAALLRTGCSVVGVDSDKTKADIAGEAGLEVVVADIEAEDGLDTLKGRQVHVVLCLDVLEHLREPGPVLHRVSEFLLPTGVVIVSIPNMTHAAVRVAMLEGRLERTDEGLLDRTHIGWYDRNAVEQLFVTAGLDVLERLSVRRQLDETEIPVDLERLPPDARSIIERDPDADIYQFLYVACVDRSTVCWPQPHPAVALIEESHRAAEVIRSATAYARHLESQISEPALHSTSEEELRLRMAELDEMRREVTYFENELRFKDLTLVELRRQAAQHEAMITTLNAAYAASYEEATQLRAHCTELEAMVAEKNAQWDVVEPQLQRLQDFEARQAEFMRLRASAGYRLADAVSSSMRRHRLLYGVARGLVRGLTSRRSATP